MNSAASSKLGGIGEAFADHNFRLYSIGAIATWIGFFVQLVAVSWYAWELTGSTTWLAIVAILDIGPNIVLMPLAGALADRFDKYWLMGVVSLLALLQAVAMALLAWWGELTIWPFAVLVLVHGIIISFMVPAMYGILPRFVARSRLTSAIAVSSSYAQLAVFLGPAIAGWVISVYGIAVAFAINALGYLIYLLSWIFLKTPVDFVPPEKSENSVTGDIVDGFRYILAHRGITSILLLMLVGDSLAAAIFYMAPAISEQLLGMGIVGVSTILAAKGAGATLAAVWIAYGGERFATVKRMMWGFLFFVLSVFLIFLPGRFGIAVVGFLVLGLSIETYGTIMTALVQLTVTEEQRGRVMGTMFMLGQGASAIGTYLIGYFALNYGLIPPIILAALICLVVWTWCFMKRKAITDNFATSQALAARSESSSQDD